jgi:hypothetical protein
MEILTTIAFAVFLILFVFIALKFFLNAYCFGTRRSLDTHNNNWFLAFIAIINLEIIYHLYYLI